MVEINEIPTAVRYEIMELSDQALSLLEIEDGDPKSIVVAITEFVREQKAAELNLPEDQAFALGALLGCQYVKGLKWHWGSVVWDGDEEGGAIGVLNHDNSLFNNPIGWVSQVMDAGSGVPFLLSYNMIEANQVPLFEPGSATGLY